MRNRSDPKTGTSPQFHSALLKREVRHHRSSRLSPSPRRFVALIGRSYPSPQSRSSRPTSSEKRRGHNRRPRIRPRRGYSADPRTSGRNRRFKGTRCRASFCRPSSTPVDGTIVSHAGRGTARTGHQWRRPVVFAIALMRLPGRADGCYHSLANSQRQF